MLGECLQNRIFVQQVQPSNFRVVFWYKSIYKQKICKYHAFCFLFCEIKVVVEMFSVQYWSCWMFTVLAWTEATAAEVFHCHYGCDEGRGWGRTNGYIVKPCAMLFHCFYKSKHFATVIWHLGISYLLDAVQFALLWWNWLQVRRWSSWSSCKYKQVEYYIFNKNFTCMLVLPVFVCWAVCNWVVIILKWFSYWR